MRAVLVAALLMCGSCSEARLFGADRAAAEADRLALSGTVCSLDPATAQLPVRIVLLVDRAAGPMFASYDPAGERVQLLNAFAQSALGSPNTELAVVGFAGRSQALAPLEGNFTRNPGELLAAISQLAVAEPCIGMNDCRDYVEGLRTARALIEGDLAQTPAGERVLTQYQVVLAIAGEAQPTALNIECCLPDDTECLNATPAPDRDCQAQREQEEVASLLDTIERSGALGASLHVLHFAAEEDEGINDRLQDSMQAVAFAGGGRYARLGAPAALTQAAGDILSSRNSLGAKTLIATNLNAKPTPSGPVTDSDADGLSDVEEAALGTSPVLADTDGDGIGDMVESLVDFDPLTPDSPAACETVDPFADTDLDGLGDCDEALLGTEPSLVDTDGDGQPDLLEAIGFTDYLEPDADQDADGDGTNNGEELRARNDPRSTDNRARLDYGYRYEIDDLGVGVERVGTGLASLTGVVNIVGSQGTTAGVGRIRYDVDRGTLAWRDAQDSDFGEAIAIGNEDAVELVLPSGSYAAVQGAEGRQIAVRVERALLPDIDVEEELRIVERSRHCLAYTVRNIRLMDTLDSDPAPDVSNAGQNRIVLFFAETAANRLDAPGPFRISEVPVVFRPPDYRSPPDALLVIRDDEFRD